MYSAGQVIGINTAAATSTAGKRADPEHRVRDPDLPPAALIPGLRTGGTVGKPGAFLGVEVVSVNPGGALQLGAHSDKRRTGRERVPRRPARAGRYRCR